MSYVVYVDVAMRTQQRLPDSGTSTSGSQTCVTVTATVKEGPVQAPVQCRCRICSMTLTTDHESGSNLSRLAASISSSKTENISLRTISCIRHSICSLTLIETVHRTAAAPAHPRSRGQTLISALTLSISVSSLSFCAPSVHIAAYQSQRMMTQCHRKAA